MYRRALRARRLPWRRLREEVRWRLRGEMHRRLRGEVHWRLRGEMQRLRREAH
jgi:hypothetical protein